MNHILCILCFFCGETIVRSWFDNIKEALQNCGMDLSTQLCNEMLEGFMQQHPKPPSLDLLALLQDDATQRSMTGPKLRQQQMACAKAKVAARPASKTVIKEDKKQKAPEPKAKAGPKARGRPQKQQERGFELQ